MKHSKELKQEIIELKKKKEELRILAKQKAAIRKLRQEQLIEKEELEAEIKRLKAETDNSFIAKTKRAWNSDKRKKLFKTIDKMIRSIPG